MLAAALGPLLRGLITRYAVPEGEPWRRECDSCGAGLWVLSPLGRCLRCGARLGPAPAAVEISAAVVCGLLAWRMSDPWVLAALCWLGLLGVVLTWVDVAVHRLPDPLTYSAYAGVLVLLGLAAIVHGDFGRLGAAVLSGLGVGIFYFVLVLLSPVGMGLGDAKLALSTGTALGWAGWVFAVYGAALGIVIGGVSILFMLALRRIGRKDEVPHGPFMLVGTLIVALLVA